MSKFVSKLCREGFMDCYIVEVSRKNHLGWCDRSYDLARDIDNATKFEDRYWAEQAFEGYRNYVEGETHKLSESYRKAAREQLELLDTYSQEIVKIAP